MLFKIKLAAVKACKHDPTHVETTALLVFLSCVKVRLFVCSAKARFNNLGSDQSHKRREYVYREVMDQMCQVAPCKMINVILKDGSRYNCHTNCSRVRNFPFNLSTRAWVAACVCERVKEIEEVKREREREKGVSALACLAPAEWTSAQVSVWVSQAVWERGSVKGRGEGVPWWRERGGGGGMLEDG